MSANGATVPSKANGHRSAVELTACIDALKPLREHEDRLILWLDIDVRLRLDALLLERLAELSPRQNCLYSKHCGIAAEMDRRIQDFFVNLGMDADSASQLHRRYYKEYGLSIRGLVRHHSIDPLDFDAKVDGALPLDEILKPDQALRQLIQSIDTSRVKICALTNAYRRHALRVLKVLQVDDLFELIMSCDYANPTFRCKPEKEYWTEAMHQVGVLDPSRHYYVDDSSLNVAGALAFGWQHSILFDEDGSSTNEAVPASSRVRRLEDLRTIWASEIFKS